MDGESTVSKNAGAIHARFMTLDGARQARISGSYTNIGIAIVQKNGYYYVVEILIG
jgi:C-terminal processing protease CtpA/Prc